ncbi:uncharacterized protein F4822DRAFT_96676 [Hypoxylon trugodes]|uniref:uncharacterized protein n=1 Tax=Hypoxylon trugodes TaxID=326681 RepID=UPI00219DD49F|nr:uncharacterized protein F4822DRAFT_96676 [Hypoxylon trugodes]KAI1382785.1 hypothetical protein F4822DRAFT_96676 [Hypoxylon trugodes]
MSQQPLRPLLPNAPNPPRVEALSQTQHRAKRIATPAACEACRKRKSKCTAERPRCSVCIERSTACEYTTLPTETHLRAQKRKLTDLEIKCQAYEDLFGIMRSRPDEETAQVIQRLRMGEEAQTIVQAISDSDLLLQLSLKPDLRFRYEFPYLREMPVHLNRWPNPYLQSILFEKVDIQPPATLEALKAVEDESKKVYLVPYHTVELKDNRISSMNVSTWTTVSSDNPMLRVLLQIYFIFEFPFHPYFHKEMFLDDMSTGNKRFCSPLLVNAVLGAAWHGYSRMKNRAEYWKPDNLGYRFLAEARRLFELEQADPMITTVQAAAIINLTCNFNGIDELSWFYTYKTFEMANAMSLFSPTQDESKEWQVVAGTTAWCLYNWQAFATFHTFQPPILNNPPARPLPDLDDAPAYYGEIEVKYPLGRTAIAISNGLVFRAVSEFRVIMNEVTRLSFVQPRTFNRMPLDAAIRLKSRLLAWYEGLPEPLKARNIAMPSHIKMHIHYHVLLISLFEPFMHMGYIHAEVDPNTVVSHSKACFETLMRVYYLRHGFESLDVTLVQFLHLLGFSALRDMASVENGSATHEALRSTMILCAKGLWEQGQNYYVAEAIFRLLRQSMSAEDIYLLREIAEVEDGDGRLDHMAQEIRSRWPIGVFSMINDNGDHTLEHFVHWWEQYSQDKALDGMAAEQEGPNVIPPRYPQRYAPSLTQA